MQLAYFKRLRMEIELDAAAATPADAPAPYGFLPWQDALLDAFARAKYLSFREELDARVIPCLGEFEGCQKLMRQIARNPGFLPGATWLLVRSSGEGRPLECCGTIQGICDGQGAGAIQNLGVVREHRGRGLGAGLLLRSLAGFCRAGVRRVGLEVTVQNAAAIRLYRRVGFTVAKTVYKAVEAASTP